MDFDILVPLGICVVLPVMIVWLVTRARQNETNKKTEIMLKAIESGATIDANFFKEKQGAKTIKERLLSRLTWGSIFSLIGVVLLVLAIVFANSYAPDGWIVNSSPAPTFATIGGILLAIDLALFAVFFVSKKMMAREAVSCAFMLFRHMAMVSAPICELSILSLVIPWMKKEISSSVSEFLLRFLRMISCGNMT